MTVESNNTSYVIGDNVTITCSTGHAFSVNLTLNITDRVTASKTLMCIDDPAGSEGKWSEEVGNCSGTVLSILTPLCLVDCSVPKLDEPIHHFQGD